MKIGKHEFSLGNDREGKERRKGVERRTEDMPVENDRRKSSDRRNKDKPAEDGKREVSDRRRQEPPTGEDAEVEEDKG